MSVLADLDHLTGKLQIQRWYLDRDIRYAHPVLDIVFQSIEQLPFEQGPDTTVLLFESEWAPFSFQETPAGLNGYLYSMKLFPAKCFQVVTAFYKSTAELSSAISIPLADNYPSLTFEIPTKGMMLANLLHDYRRASMSKNWDNPKEALYLYMENDILISTTFGDMTNTVAREFSLPQDQLLGATYAYADSRNQRQFEMEQPPEHQTYVKKVDLLFGRKILLESGTLFIPGIVYSNITSGNWHSDMKNLVCLSSIGCSDWQPNTYHTVFAEVLL